ncbi:MAG: cation:proton antiporter [Terriglobales bacterium]
MPMDLRGIAVIVLLGIGVLLFALTAAGLLLARDVYDQVHYLAPGTLVGSLAIALAVLLHEGFSQAGVKAVLIAILLTISNPILSHATARAHRIRRKHQLPPETGENIPVARKNT